MSSFCLLSIDKLMPLVYIVTNGVSKEGDRVPKQGLSKESVVQAAIRLIEEKGIDQFSMAKLAQRLNLKTASLYNHIDSLNQLLECVGEDAVRRIVVQETLAIAGKKCDDALFALAEAYRTFVREHYELYRVIMAFPKLDDPTLEQEAGKIISPIFEVLSGYGLTEEQRYHWQRVLRAVMGGFAFHEQSGGFSQLPVDQDESFRIAIQCVADGLRKAGGDKH